MKKKTADIMMIIIAAAGFGFSYMYTEDNVFRQFLIVICIGVILLGSVDLIRKWITERMRERGQLGEGMFHELALLDEDDRIIKQWDMQDKVSMSIGRSEKETAVDIDLTDSEYGALVDYQHAVLNYSSGSWYIEDLESKNGIRIKKQLDGVCYQMAKDRPCKLVSGDVILIANTKLLYR